MIAKGYKANFETLCRAIENGDVCLMECNDAVTGKPVMVVCAVQRDGDSFEMMPLAKLFDGNPYEELIPPTMEEA
jgi:hypothetical protein